MCNLIHFQKASFKWPLFLTMESYLNNLLVEETIEEQCDPILNLCLKEHTPSLLLGLACLTFSVSSWVSGEISHLRFQEEWLHPTCAWKPGLCMAPWQAGNAKSEQYRRSLRLSLLSLRTDLPGQRGIGILQNATARQPGTKQGTLRMGQGHQTLQEGEAGLRFLSLEQNSREECTECSPIMNPLITNDRCLVLGLFALPTSAQFTGRRLWFWAWKHNVTLTQEVSCYS